MGSIATVDPSKVLSYGAIGLGFLLAALSFLLLSAEQRRTEIRPTMLRATYVFMAFSLALSAFGFGVELYKFGRLEMPLSNAASFSRVQPTLRAPATHSEHSIYPRDLQLSWDALAGAASYRVESQIQVTVEGQNRVEWYDLEPKHVSSNKAQIRFGGASWGQWRVIGINERGEESQPSDWWTFHFTK